jgi:cell division protein FtsQ
MWIKVLRVTGLVVSIAALFVLLVAAVKTSNDAVLKDVIVNIDYSGENFFLEETDLVDAVYDLGYHKDSTKLNQIDPGQIEYMMTNQAFVEDAEVYKELNGDLHVQVTVRKPIVRVFNDLGASVYIDRMGYIMPLSSHFTARTPIANGEVTIMLQQYIGRNVAELADLTEHPDAALLEEIYHLASAVSMDEFWSAQFNQIYVAANGELELIPRVGDHRILIGNTRDLDKKLNKLWQFYEKGLKRTGWNEYETINLKYANQVVCTKR